LCALVGIIKNFISSMHGAIMKIEVLRVFENMVLRKVFGPKRDEVTGDWRRVHHEKLYDIYSTPDIIRMIKSKMMRWAGHMVRVAERRMHAGLCG
jgi:hypothetical protein